MNERAKNCAAYFRDRPAWRRPMELLLQKYRRYGRSAGEIVLPDATHEECEAVRGLFGRSFSAPLRFKTVDFETALQQTSLGGVPLKELLEAYFDCSIQTKKQTRSQLEARLSRAFAQVEAASQSESFRSWLRALSNKQGGYQLVRKAAAGGQPVEEALLPLDRCVAWLEAHPGQKIRLAVLSALTASDPHALDSGTLCGKLLPRLLADRAGRAAPNTAEQRDGLYYQSGILCDSISSSVTQTGLALYAGDDEHPAFHAFRNRHEVCTLSLTNLAALTAGRSPSGRAYLVENQMVFSQLADHAAAFHSPLICTSGQPTVAVLRLLDLLSDARTELFYSGDFDGKGLSIATQLLLRYPARLHTWHMTPEDYAQCCSDVELTPQSVQLLQGCHVSLRAVADELLKRRLAGYQELLLPRLLADLID